MKQFTLDEYLKNPSRKVVTRDGQSVRIICTDALGKDFPVVGLIPWKNEKGVPCELPMRFTANGNLSLCGQSIWDLFFAPVKQSRWVYLHKNAYGDVCSSRAFMTEDDAKEAMEVLKGFGLTEITWEE